MKIEYVTTRVFVNFIVYFSKCPSSVFVAVNDIMTTYHEKQSQTENSTVELNKLKVTENQISTDTKLY